MLRVLGSIALLLAISACGGKNSRTYEDYHPGTAEDRREARMGSLITGSQESIVIYGDNKIGGNKGSGFVTSYMWKAAVESISFMPLVSSDSNGGIILTDWYSAPESSNEKFKFTIIISSTEVQLTSVKVIAFKQVLRGGSWHSVNASKELSRDIEDKILQKAIILKASSAK